MSNHITIHRARNLGFRADPVADHPVWWATMLWRAKVEDPWGLSYSHHGEDGVNVDLFARYYETFEELARTMVTHGVTWVQSPIVAVSGGSGFRLMIDRAVARPDYVGARSIVTHYPLAQPR